MRSGLEQLVFAVSAWQDGALAVHFANSALICWCVNGLKSFTAAKACSRIFMLSIPVMTTEVGKVSA